ncbi:Pimeloyl-ACP methyl ester carboxylesterase [Amycolatopsis xylanica]|uniref:Pimeloyl-ACP methyl ester carboxylesterase n=1 Tax=Amycolatopsis xylanica TaxID=589385 RepID=A0A1H3IPZ6_9PSEU|nr:alpha/beta hydrolase [Amycolatopsis xylanica]SDY29780.1 Pimeloyl-ACP methyl ester carboxylesterase [Amycolatopsis xylanica]
MGIPVVLLHALGSTAATWNGFAARFDGTRRVLAVDLPGHGDGARPERYSLDLMADEVLAFLDTQGISRVDLVGHSMGGRVAVLIAQREPALVRRLVIEDTPPPPDLPKEPLAPVTEPAEPLPFDWRLIEPIMTELRSPDPGWWARLGAITARTLLVSGGPTSHVPVDALARVSRAIADCELVVIEDAGHRVHSTKPDEFWKVAGPFLEGS